MHIDVMKALLERSKLFGLLVIDTGLIVGAAGVFHMKKWALGHLELGEHEQIGIEFAGWLFDGLILLFVVCHIIKDLWQMILSPLVDTCMKWSKRPHTNLFSEEKTDERDG